MAPSYPRASITFRRCPHHPLASAWSLAINFGRISRSISRSFQNILAQPPPQGARLAKNLIVCRASSPSPLTARSLAAKANKPTSPSVSKAPYSSSHIILFLENCEVMAQYKEELAIEARNGDVNESSSPASQTAVVEIHCPHNGCDKVQSTQAPKMNLRCQGVVG